MFGVSASRAAVGAMRTAAVRPAVNMAARPAAVTAFKAPLGARRGYAEAVSDKLQLNLILPHAVRVVSVAGGCRASASRSEGHHRC